MNRPEFGGGRNIFMESVVRSLLARAEGERRFYDSDDAIASEARRLHRQFRGVRIVARKQYRGHTAEVVTDADSRSFSGRVIDIPGTPTIEGATLPELTRAFEATVDAYLARSA